MFETVLFSGKNYTADKNFTRPTVAAVVTNIKCASTWQIFLLPESRLTIRHSTSFIVLHSCLHQNEFAEKNELDTVQWMARSPFEYFANEFLSGTKIVLLVRRFKSGVAVCVKSGNALRIKNVVLKP